MLRPKTLVVVARGVGSGRGLATSCAQHIFTMLALKFGFFNSVVHVMVGLEGRPRVGVDLSLLYHRPR